MVSNRPCDVFISYSNSSGSTPAKKLMDAIKQKGLEPFAFEYSLASGHPWDEQVLRQLLYSRCVLVLVPPRRKRLTDWMNHEIGIARAMKKKIIPIALGGDFRSSAPMSDMLSRFWGCPLDQLLSDLDSFISEQELASAARVTLIWSEYLVSGSPRILVGGIDPARLQDQERRRGQGLEGDYFSIGVFRSITRLSCFFSQQFGAAFLDKLLVAQKTTDEEISQHDLIVIGGPNSLHKSPLQTCHKDLGIHFDDTQGAYLVGPRRHKVGIEHEPDDFAGEGCVLGFACNPMNYQKEMLLVSGVSGYGCQGAIEYLVGTRIDAKLAEAVDRWRGSERDAPLLFELSTKFKGSTYVRGSGTARQIESDPLR
jgi:hypothetical protein